MWKLFGITTCFWCCLVSLVSPWCSAQSVAITQLSRTRWANREKPELDPLLLSWTPRIKSLRCWDIGLKDCNCPKSPIDIVVIYICRDLLDNFTCGYHIFDALNKYPHVHPMFHSTDQIFLSFAPNTPEFSPLVAMVSYEETQKPMISNDTPVLYIYMYSHILVTMVASITSHALPAISYHHCSFHKCII